MYEFEKLTKQDVDALINDFCKMYEEFTMSVPESIVSDVMNQLIMSPEEYRSLGMNEIADAVEDARARG